jgi:DNA-binding transcriptional LysR family regulator
MSHDHLRGLDLNLLFTFDALLEFGSVTRAARHLDVTQSAVSHSLRKLRAYFGDQLFVKGGDGVVPTHRARVLSRAVRQIVEVARASLAVEAGFDPATARRVVTLSMSDMGEVSLLPALVEKLRNAAPLCSLRTVNLHPPELEPALQNGDVDLLLSGPLKLSQGILHQRIFTHRLAVIAGKAASHKRPLTLARYADAEHVAVASARSDLSLRNLAWRKLNVAPRVYLMTPHITAVPWVLAHNPALIATVPHYLAQMFAKIGLVQILETEFPLPTFPIHQYWHRRLGEDRFSVWFRKFVRQLVHGVADLNRA